MVYLLKMVIFHGELLVIARFGTSACLDQVGHVLRIDLLGARGYRKSPRYICLPKKDVQNGDCPSLYYPLGNGLT